MSSTIHVVPSTLVDQACAVAAQQGWYKVEASFTLPCGSRASIVGWRPNAPIEPAANARAPFAQKQVPPEPSTTNSHASKNSATSDKEVMQEAVPDLP